MYIASTSKRFYNQDHNCAARRRRQRSVDLALRSEYRKPVFHPHRGGGHPHGDSAHRADGGVPGSRFGRGRRYHHRRAAPFRCVDRPARDSTVHASAATDIGSSVAFGAGGLRMVFGGGGTQLAPIHHAVVRRLGTVRAARAIGDAGSGTDRAAGVVAAESDPRGALVGGTLSLATAAVPCYDLSIRAGVMSVD